MPLIEFRIVSLEQCDRLEHIEKLYRELKQETNLRHKTPKPAEENASNLEGAGVAELNKDQTQSALKTSSQIPYDLNAYPPPEIPLIRRGELPDLSNELRCERAREKNVNIRVLNDPLGAVNPQDHPPVRPFVATPIQRQQTPGVHLGEPIGKAEAKAIVRQWYCLDGFFTDEEDED